MPYPCRAWLTISNDPDNTGVAEWNELNSFIWGELNLPLSDALFVRSWNCNLPDQVNLFDQPHIADAHYHDALHGWGDYMHARKRGFDREDAEDAIDLLNRHGIKPAVWVDHSSQNQNFIHYTTNGSTPQHNDGGGHVYKNFAYTLDLAVQIGIRYIWDGGLTPILGQDTHISPGEWYRKGKSFSPGKATVFTLLDRAHRIGVPVLGAGMLSFQPDINRQYFPHRFPDGQTLYCFRRYGTWKDADIDGLGELISPDRVDELVKRQGTCIVYSHLGKRKAARQNVELHIPESTRVSLRNLREKFLDKTVMVSPLSTLLDYLVIRDNISVSVDNKSIDFQPDGIRYRTLEAADIVGQTFGFRISDADLAAKISITFSGERSDACLEQIADEYYTVKL